MSDRPTCAACGREMTPQNARLHPELFLCDRCLPVELAGPADEGIAPRMAFDKEAFARMQHFAEQLLAAIPEMEGVAIIPSWEVPQEHVPFGIVKGRHGPLRTPKEIQHMAVQVHGCLRQQLENAYAVIQGLDAEMGRMAKELDELRQRAARESRPADPGSGTPPGSP